MDIEPALQKQLLGLRERFLAELPERQRAVAEALEDLLANKGQAEPAWRSVHTLAGGAATYGMLSLADAARELEDFLKSLERGGEDAGDHAEEIRSLHRSTTQAAEQLRKLDPQEWLREYLRD